MNYYNAIFDRSKCVLLRPACMGPLAPVFFRGSEKRLVLNPLPFSCCHVFWGISIERFFPCVVLSFQVLTEKSKSVAGVQQWPYRAVAKALEVIPRTLIQNCGANTIRTLTALRVSTLHYGSDRLAQTHFRENLHTFAFYRSDKNMGNSM